ncbi:MAG: IgGFc-binding protein [Minicystis sp.]
MTRSILSLGFVSVAAFVSYAAGCAATGTNQFLTGGAGGASASSSGNTDPTFSGSGTGASGTCSAGPHCSSDLHSMVDCDNNVLGTCPADQGCSGSGCVPACDSAVENKSNIGCEYWAVDPDVILDGAGACYAAFLANTWTTPVTITVEYDGQTLDPSTFGFIPSGSGQGITYKPIQNAQIPAGEVAIFFLNRHFGFPSFLKLDCPIGIVPAVTAVDTATHGTSLGKAFHITSSAPVVAYDIFPYGGGESAMTSATLLLPTSAWDTNYIAVDAFGPGLIGQPFVEIVAQKDGTMVTINPSADIVGGTGVAATKQGVPQTYAVNRGQVLQFTQNAPLAGSVIQADGPIGVWGGKSALGIESCCDDTGHQQIPPVRALGNEYVGVRYRNRYDGQEESPPWRIIGAVDGTVLTYEPAPPNGAPTKLARGEVTQFNAAGPFVVRSQDADHPFYMSAHMTGAGGFDPDGVDGRGDAEFVNVIPPGEFLQSYVFFTDPTYPETDLVLVRVKGSKGFSDVELDCAGKLGGWQPLGTSGQYEYTRFDLVRHNFQPQGNCNNGRHEIKSAGPFGLTVWGWGSAETGNVGIGFYTQYVSYAYPAGAGVKPINQVEVPAIPK